MKTNKKSISQIILLSVLIFCTVVSFAIVAGFSSIIQQ